MNRRTFLKIMENRKDNYTPRDRIDDELLFELLRENEPSCSGYGRYESEAGSGCTGRSLNCSGSSNSVAACDSSARRSSCKSSQAERRNIRSSRCPSQCDTSFEANQDDGKSCIEDSCINKYPPAMVYCPDQAWSDLYEVEKALAHGTLFSVLDLPFYGSSCNNCR